MGLKAIVLAAGQGTRMRSELPKVVHRIAGRPLVSWVLDSLSGIVVDDAVVVVGHAADKVHSILPEGTTTALQEPQLGTAHAASVGLEALDIGPDDEVLVLYGDMPLIQSESLQLLIEARRGTGAKAGLLTAVVDNPTDYGRVLRNDWDAVIGVVEHRDATPTQRRIKEINTGIYVFNGREFGSLLEKIRPDNQQGEFYLTDVIGIIVDSGSPMTAVRVDREETLGINSMEQLAEASRVMHQRINKGWMEQGVRMDDPSRVYIDGDVDIASGVHLYPGVHLEGATTIGETTVIGPDTLVRDSNIGAHCSVRYAVVEGAQVGGGVAVGPYARLRPGTVMKDDSKAGSFVELKKTIVGEGSKVPHLSYMGDAILGEGVNIGAGSITCNWDGEDKHQTVIGDGAFIGSDTMLVAPVTVGDDGWTGAGSVITRDVSPGALAVERNQQKEIEGYNRRRQAREETEDS